MNSDNPSCQFCNEEFSEFNQPHLLPDCGHSICSNCISNILREYSTIICRDDNIEAVGRKQLSDFPKNYSLLQFIQRRSTSRLGRSSGCRSYETQRIPNIQKQSSHNFDYCENSSSSTSEKHFLSNSTEATKQMMVEEFIKKQLIPNTPLSGDELSDCFSLSNPPETTERCLTHRKKNDILCLNCRVKVCSNCALFGGHKIHHVMPVDEAVQQMSKRAENLVDIYKAVDQARKEILNEKMFHQMIRDHLSDHQEELIEKTEAIFFELQEQLIRKKSRLIEDIKKRISQMELACQKHLNELVNQIAGKADLWIMTTKSKLDYFTDKTEKGELPIDILTQNDNSGDIIVIGEQILQELNIAKMDVLNRMEELTQKQLKIECKGGLEKMLDTMFNLVLRTPNQDHILLRDSIASSRQNSQSMKMESSGGQSFMRMVVGDANEKLNNEPFLLKDINNSSLFMDSLSNPQYLKYQEAINLGQEFGSPKRVSFLQDIPPSPSSHTKGSYRSSNVSNNRKISPSPGGKRTGSIKSKLSRLPDKYQIIIQGLKNDSIEIADFTGADMGDEALNQLIPLILNSTKLRVLKLVKNKISDISGSNLINQILIEQNKDQYSLPTNILASVNLSNNMLTEKIIDLLLEQTRKNQETMHVQSLRSIYLNQNLINGQRVKKKTDEMKKIGVNVQI